MSGVYNRIWNDTIMAGENEGGRKQYESLCSTYHVTYHHLILPAELEKLYLQLSINQ
jgi:hypothetical protein